jgi:hypothetical protein
MGLEIKQAKVVTSLATSAVCVHIDIRMPGLTVEDTTVTDEVLADKKADPNAGKFMKDLTAKHPAFKALGRKRQAIYNWNTRKTYDWRGAIRLLPVVDLPEYRKGYDEHKAEFDDLAAKFVNEWPSIVSDAAFKQGAMFRREEYPTADYLQSRIKCDLFLSDIPTGDFRVQVSQDLADDLYTNYSIQHQNILENIHNKQKTALLAVLNSLSNTCDVEMTLNDKGEVRVERGRLHETTVQKALDLCNTYAEFNVTNDPKLEEARVRLAGILNQLSGMQTDVVAITKNISKDDAMRHALKSEVDDILSMFGGA